MSISIAKVNHNTYNVSFFSKTIITTVDSNSSTVSKWISEVLEINSHCLRNLVVGLDTEWGYSAPKRMNPLSTVQICVGDRCLVYQIIQSKGDIPQSLVEFLSNPDFSFVGVCVADDQKKIFSEYGIVGGPAVDLRFLAAKRYCNPELRKYGLKTLASLVMRRDIGKSESVSKSNWANRRLTDDQVKYACVDAYASYEIGSILDASNADA